MKLSIGTKLIISTITLLIFSIIISLSTFYILNKTRNENINIINKYDSIALKASRLMYHSLEMGNGIRGILLDHNNQLEKNKKLEADNNFESVIKQMKYIQVDSKLNDFIDSLSELDRTKLNVSENNVISMTKVDIKKANQMYWTEYMPIKLQFNKIIEDLDNYISEEKNKALKDLEDNYNKTLNLIYTLLFLLVSSGILFIFYIYKSISNPISKIILDSNRIFNESVEGNLDVNISSNLHSGEFREILLGMNNIIKSITSPIKESVSVLQKISQGDFSELVEGNYKGDHALLKNALNQTIESISHLLEQVTIVSQQVSIGSEQLSSTSQILSQGSTQQAAAIEEITTSMQDISSQTIKNAENANKANQLSIIALDYTKKGNEQIEELKEAMKEINSSSKNISKIIKVIDEIAFQTNLLALNAAVEAARAGKHGKGFSVVAEEVRNLAARSAIAAKETSELIEVAMKRAENGVMITEKTSEVLKEINQGNNKVTEIVNEIAAYSNEQAQGISQVNSGLEQIAMVTNQTTSSAEECASASEELYHQSDELLKLIKQFKLKGQKVNISTNKLLKKPNNSLVISKPREIIKLDDNDMGRY